MKDQLAKASLDRTEASPSDMAMLFNFLKVSSPKDLRGRELEDRLLTSLAIALRGKVSAH